MARQASVKSQIQRAYGMLPKLELEYNNSLYEKNISANLKLDIQAFFNHLRSALDYLAKDIVEKHCPKAKSKDRLYFPITNDNTSFTQFMCKSYPDLVNNCPDLYRFLESIQPYTNPKNKWLTQFNAVNNEYKHNDLIEQTKTEIKTVHVTNPSKNSVSWGSEVRFGDNVKVLGIPIDPRTQLPVPNNMVKTKVITWVDFKFNNINISALWLLKESLKQVVIIDSEINKYLALRNP